MLFVGSGPKLDGASSNLYIFIVSTPDLYIFLKKSLPAKMICLFKGANLYIFFVKWLPAKISTDIFIKSH